MKTKFDTTSQKSLDKEISVFDVQLSYEQFYQEVLNDMPDNEVTITSESSEGTKVFIERNFYLCGFNWLYFKCNTPENRKLKKLLGAKKDSYWGFIVPVTSIGQRGNGDYEIQSQAFSKLARWLNDQGYTVRHYSNLD